MNTGRKQLCECLRSWRESVATSVDDPFDDGYFETVRRLQSAQRGSLGRFKQIARRWLTFAEAHPENPTPPDCGAANNIADFYLVSAWVGAHFVRETWDLADVKQELSKFRERRMERRARKREAVQDCEVARTPAPTVTPPKPARTRRDGFSELVCWAWRTVCCSPEPDALGGPQA